MAFALSFSRVCVHSDARGSYLFLFSLNHLFGLKGAYKPALDLVGLEWCMPNFELVLDWTLVS